VLSIFSRKFITPSIHLCLQHDCHDAAHCASSSATANTCIDCMP